MKRPIPSTLNNLHGKTLTNVYRNEDEVHFITDGGEHYTLYHDQCCCELVVIESIVGDLNDLVGEPILMAEEVSGSCPNVEDVLGYEPESYTWTFYKFATQKGYVDMRWIGESNGYYSEGVDFARIE